MPRAFLVVKKKPADPSIQQSKDSSLILQHNQDLMCTTKPDYEMAPPPLMDRPSPLSSPSYSSDEPHSPATSELREGRVSPPSEPHHLPYHSGHMMEGVFDLSHKRKRLDSSGQFMSPKSIQSDSGSDISSASPPPQNIVPNLDRHRYHLLPNINPKSHKDPFIPSPPNQQIPQNDKDSVQPLSPLHHLVRNNAAAAMFQGYPGFPHPGFPLPFMRAPFFMPHQFRPYPQFVPQQPVQQEINNERMTHKEEIKQVERIEKPKSSKPKISHNIEDLLARSPPKKQRKPVEELKPVVIAPLDPAQFPSNDSPIHNLVAMDRLYAQSPSHFNHQSNFHTQSPKTGSFAPKTAPLSPRLKQSKTLARNLEADFKKQYLETLLPEALRQQHKLAEEYSQTMIQDRRSRVPDIKQQQCFTQVEQGYIQEFPRETIFPTRQDDSKEMSLAERLSPSALEAVPVDFSKSSSKKPGPPRFQCDGCKKSYSTLNGLSKHKEFHCVSHVKKEFSCKHCSKTYTTLGALKMHIRTHTLPCKCHLCGKAFSRPWLLQGHIRTHTGEKPFSCQHCSRSFADRSNLRAHLQTHTDVKRYSCNTCTKTFSRMSLLTKHKENGCVGLQHR